MARAFVASRVVLKVKLVVLLSRPPLSSRGDLCDNLAIVPLGVGLCRDVARNGLLLGGVEVDGGAVLRASIGTLGVESGGVVHAVEELEQLTVRDLVGVEDDLSSFSI